MSSYSELIKNFEKIRSYMREFYVYGFKSRDEYDKRSARSYDDERRRMESWLGEHMRFVRSAEGKNTFISIDSRSTRHNPFFKAWKAKSFTDGDISLHFILFDILHSPEVSLSLSEICELMDKQYLSSFDCPMLFDESTVRKKLKEYCSEGLIVASKQGKRMLYSRASNAELPKHREFLDFYSEIAPCGVVGSFLLDKGEAHEDVFAFKHHYITNAIDSDVLAMLFVAMREKRAVCFDNLSRKRGEVTEIRAVPLRIFISTQNGRQHLLAYWPKFNSIQPFRVDYISNVRLEDETPRFDELRGILDGMKKKMWGVNTSRTLCQEVLESVEFTVRVDSGEDYIVGRLEREKRTGCVEKIDKNHYRYSASVYDSSELVPWIRTFICRICELKMSNKILERRFKNDIKTMYKMYGIEEEEHGIQ